MTRTLHFMIELSVKLSLDYTYNHSSNICFRKKIEKEKAHTHNIYIQNSNQKQGLACDWGLIKGDAKLYKESFI